MSSESSKNTEFVYIEKGPFFSQVLFLENTICKGVHNTDIHSHKHTNGNFKKEASPSSTKAEVN